MVMLIIAPLQVLVSGVGTGTSVRSEMCFAGLVHPKHFAREPGMGDDSARELYHRNTDPQCLGRSTMNCGAIELKASFLPQAGSCVLKINTEVQFDYNAEVKCPTRSVFSSMNELK